MSNSIQHPLVSAPFGPAPLRSASAAAVTSPAQRVGFWFVLVFVFTVFARVPELLSIQFGINLPFVMAISAFAGLAALFAMDFRRLSMMPAVIWLLLFTGWLMIAGLFSSWHGGTFQMFKDYWSKAILICIVTSMLVVTLEDLRKVMYAVAYATLVIIAAGLIWSGTVVGRLEIFKGSQASLSNPNELASRLLTGFCFCLFLLSTQRGFSIKRLVVGVSIPVLLVMALRTGSRSGLLTLLVLFVMLALRASGKQKFLMFVGLILAAFVLFVVLPKDAVDRYATIFSSADDQAGLTRDQQIAVSSEEARKELLQEGITLAFQHPVFGVGPGVYAAAAAGVAKDEGRRASWHETHNTYVQIVAENGVPGLILYAAAIFYCVRKTYKLYRRTGNHPDLLDLSQMSYCFLLALVSWMLGALFDSEGYRLEFPLLAALTCAFALAAESKIRQLTAAAALPRAPLGASSAPGTAPMPAAPKAPAFAPAASQAAQPARNPFRFGRMRRP